MAYILRTYIKKKYFLNGLTSVYGIGNSLSKNLCNRLGFQKKFLLKDLSSEDIYFISQLIDKLKIDIKGDLQRWLQQKTSLLLSLRTYRGIRQKQGLPLRGQRTHTNARTAKKFRMRKTSSSLQKVKSLGKKK